MSGCGTVFHVASPFFLPEQIKDPQRELLEPALKGTRDVLGAVNRCASLDKVVLTSTIGAMFGDYADVLGMKGRMLTEDQSNTSSTFETIHTTTRSLIGPLLGLSQSYIRNHLGIRFTLNNQRSVDELGLRYRSIDETLEAHYEAWQARRDAIRT